MSVMRPTKQMHQLHGAETAGNIRNSAEPRSDAEKYFGADEVEYGLCPREISRQLSILIIVTLAGLVLSILSDRGSFFVWQDPLSDLGALRTVNGQLNVVPRTIFDFTMTISGILMFRVYSLLSIDINLQHAVMKRIMTFAGGIGFFMLLMPYDVDLAVHEVGASLVFATLWGMTVLFSVELRRASLTTRALLAQVVLQGTVLPYAVLFVADMPSEVIAQKFAVAGMMFALWYTGSSGRWSLERRAEYGR